MTAGRQTGVGLVDHRVEIGQQRVKRILVTCEGRGILDEKILDRSMH